VQESINRRISVQAGLGIKLDSISKIITKAAHQKKQLSESRDKPQNGRKSLPAIQ
jgi:hypothetical protein